MGHAPQRSPVGGVYRSATGSVLLRLGETPEPPPIPVQTFFPCTVSFISSAAGACDSGTPEEYCPGQQHQVVSGTSITQFEWHDVGMDAPLNWKNFPVSIVNNETQEVLFTIAPPNCRQYPFNCYRDVVDRWVYNGYDATCFDTPALDDALFGLILCSLDGVIVPDLGSNRLGTLVQTAQWEITEINATEGWLRIGENWLKGGDVVAIFNDPVNAGSYFVDNDSTDDRVFLTGLSAGSPGGVLVFRPGIFRTCGQYSAVGLPAFNVYQAIMRYAGDELDPAFYPATDTIVHLSNAGAYTGTHTIQAGDNSNEVKLAAKLWEGSPPPGGTWINNAIVLEGTSGQAPNGLEINGVNGYYNGFYEAGRVFNQGVELAISALKFVGTDSGTINFPGVSFNGTGLPAGYNQDVTVVVTGTTSYNGTYNDVRALNFGGTSFFFQGDLDSIPFVGSETGTWEIPAETLTGPIAAFEANSTPQSFTAVRAQKTGTVTDMLVDAMTVTASGHAVQAGWLWSAYESSEYVSSYYDVLRVVDPNTFDVAERFTQTDSGRYGAGPDVI